MNTSQSSSVQNLGKPTTEHQSPKQLVYILSLKLKYVIEAIPVETIDQEAEKFAACFVACRLMTEYVADEHDPVRDHSLVHCVIQCHAYLNYLLADASNQAQKSPQN